MTQEKPVAVNPEPPRPKEPSLYETYLLFKAKGLLREFFRLYPS